MQLACNFSFVRTTCQLLHRNVRLLSVNFANTKADSGNRCSLQEIGQGKKRDGEDEEGDKGNHPLGNENQIVTKALENKRL